MLGHVDMFFFSLPSKLVLIDLAVVFSYPFLVDLIILVVTFSYKCSCIDVLITLAVLFS